VQITVYSWLNVKISYKLTLLNENLFKCFIFVIVTYRIEAKSIDEKFQNFLHSLNQDQIPDFFKNSNDK